MRPGAGLRLLLYDSASRGNVPFAPADPERVRIYTCGPTVYRYAHIGNLRTYLLTDLLVRTLRFLGYGTFAVQNITDMGHMHQEQLEAGEDKVIAAARAAGKSAGEIARFFTEAFFRDCRPDGVSPGRRLPEGLGARPGDDRARACARGTGGRLRGGRVPLLRRDEGARVRDLLRGRAGGGEAAERTDERSTGTRSARRISPSGCPPSPAGNSSGRAAGARGGRGGTSSAPRCRSGISARNSMSTSGEPTSASRTTRTPGRWR